MNILFIAAEAVPFVKVGGLADVVGSLPMTLAKEGHALRVLIPAHGVIDHQRHGLQPVDSFDMPWAGGSARVEVFHAGREGVDFFFLRAWPYFSGQEAFVYDWDEGVNVGRYLFFSAAALAWAQRAADRDGWAPNLLHCHDWHTGLVPFLHARLYNGSDALGGAATVFSIHNMQHQGWGVGWHLNHAGLPGVDHGLLHASGRADNCLAIGLAYSTMLSTVSPQYAREIVTPAGAYGLDSIVQARQSRLVGILNGIDTVRWDPAHSAVIKAPFSAAQIDQKAQNKRALQESLGLPPRRDLPLVAAVSRLAEQKGLDILVPGVRHMLFHAEMQFISLGAGDPHWEHEIWRIGNDFPQKAIAYLGFDEPLSEQIYAAADMFLMPSRFEPSGLGQMIAMRYGALPVVRAVGGLIDSVPPEVGFLFSEYHHDGVIRALSAGLEMWYQHPRDWKTRVQRAMALDFSWERSARQYLDLYDEARRYQRRYGEAAF